MFSVAGSAHWTSAASRSADNASPTQREQAEDKVAEEAMAIPASHAGRPERDHDPGHCEDDVPDDGHNTYPRHRPPRDDVGTEHPHEAGYRSSTMHRQSGQRGTDERPVIGQKLRRQQQQGA